jgi:ribose-phosphate pyrophosphokinase
MELLIMIDALRRASAGRITAVVPYYGYARQDRKNKARDPITAKLVANLITVAGADRLLTIDLHAPQIQGFFDIPVDNLAGNPIFVDYYAKKFGPSCETMMVVSPDVGSVARARAFAQKLHMNLAIVDKRRQKANSCEVMNVIGDVAGMDCILFDDMVDTGGSLCNAAQALLEVGGARSVQACASHGVLSGPAIERINKSAITEVALLDTISPIESKKSSKIKYLPVAPMFAEAIERIYQEISISKLFR